MMFSEEQYTIFHSYSGVFLGS